MQQQKGKQTLRVLNSQVSGKLIAVRHSEKKAEKETQQPNKSDNNATYEQSEHLSAVTKISLTQNVIKDKQDNTLVFIIRV